MAPVVPSSPVFSFRRGQHACVFYRDVDALLDVLVPYVAEGLRSGEKCFLAQSPEVWRQIKSGLTRSGFDVLAEQHRGALEWHSVAEVYGGERTFDGARLMEMLEDSIARALRSGFSGFRTAGELGWAAQTPDSFCDRLIEYERMVEEAYPKRPAVGLCQYPTAGFRPEVLARICEQHQMCLQDAHERATHSVLSMRVNGVSVDIVADRLSRERRCITSCRSWGAKRSWDGDRARAWRARSPRRTGQRRR